MSKISHCLNVTDKLINFKLQYIILQYNEKFKTSSWLKNDNLLSESLLTLTNVYFKHLILKQKLKTMLTVTHKKFFCTYLSPKLG